MHLLLPFHLLGPMLMFSVLGLVSVCRNAIALYATLQDFYEDLFEELSKYGEIESLNICDNLADHMVLFFQIIYLLHRFSFSGQMNEICSSVNRWVMYMFSLERKNMLQMHFEI